MRSYRQWFNKNFPDEIRDPSGRIIRLDDRKSRFDHLVSRSGNGGRKADPRRAESLNLIQRCIENPAEIYSKNMEFRYIGEWASKKKRRFVVICKRRKDTKIHLTTAFDMADGKIEETRKKWRERYRRV